MGYWWAGYNGPGPSHGNPLAPPAYQGPDPGPPLSYHIWPAHISRLDVRAPSYCEGPRTRRPVHGQKDLMDDDLLMPISNCEYVLLGSLLGGADSKPDISSSGNINVLIS
ncbi:hypothetical protein KSP40_PGU006566 [Platanthera guangdongensis]|uniref:Uncharacterized protein n=1 Tax=Platanthera guangdongensis TaxID=2320717 RepID=A0ABR2LLL6_9ASPA